MYYRWASARLREPYNSFGNGAAMRVSPIGFAFETMEDVLAWSKRSAEVTPNHPEGIRVHRRLLPQSTSHARLRTRTR